MYLVSLLKHGTPYVYFDTIFSKPIVPKWCCTRMFVWVANVNEGFTPTYGFLSMVLVGGGEF